MLQHFIPMPERKEIGIRTNFTSKYARPMGIALLNIAFASGAVFAIAYAATTAVRVALL